MKYQNQFVNKMRSGLLALAAFAFAHGTSAQQSPDGLWFDAGPVAARGVAEYWVKPEKFRAVMLDHDGMRRLLGEAPRESIVPVALSQTIITLPMPDGAWERFQIVESPVMEPELAAKFPLIKTYVGQGIDDDAATVRLDMTPAGFHAQVLSPRRATYIDPHLRDGSIYASYFKRDYRRAAGDFVCEGPLRKPGAMARSATGLFSSNGTNLRTYRLACAATAEYTAYQGGTVSNGLAAVVTAVNRVTGIYEIELAIRMVLVANNNLLIYTDSGSDPYSNNNSSLLLTQNQNNLDSVIGSANYDIGHVFSTAGGGLAMLGCVCDSTYKAQGETGTSAPIGDAFYVDYVAHEMGHQFGANHTFNSETGSCGGGNRNAGTAYEVGSGSTIMAYAGICGINDLQPHSDPYFHFASLDEIIAYSTGGDGNTCAVITPTTNSIPSVSAGPNFTIPKSTPFILTASGSDANGDTLTYCWEDRNLGAATSIGAADNGSSPLFRSYNPVTGVTSRIFPQITNILANTSSSVEVLPTTSRTMTFRATVRDNRAGGGAVNSSEAQVTIATNAGPFTVSSFNSGGTYSGTVAVTWNVAGTTNAPVSCANVAISLSTNGGFDFPTILHPSTPNSGSANVVLPNITSTNARIKIESVGNIFFDICNASFTIVPGVPTPAIALDSAAVIAENCAPTNGRVDPLETVTVNFALRNIGTAVASNVVATLLSGGGVAVPSGSQNYGAVTNGSAVSRPFSFVANAGCGGAVTCSLQIVNGTNNLGIGSYVFSLGQQAVLTNVFSNSTAIAIPTSGSGVPYPSTIAVSGLAGTVTKITARLDGIMHSYPDDIDVLLVGPGGQNVMLMSDCGLGFNITNVVLTFDDSAASQVPNVTLITTGTYLPTDYETGETMPSPAPSGTYGSALSAFNGVNPNGTWSLYVADDTSGDTGTVVRGWSLSITTTNLLCCGLAPTSSIASFAVGGSSMFFAGTNGIPFGTNFVLTTTNIMQPLNQWLRIATNVFDATGSFVYTNAPGTNQPQRFFIIQTP